MTYIDPPLSNNPLALADDGVLDKYLEGICCSFSPFTSHNRCRYPVAFSVVLFLSLFSLLFLPLFIFILAGRRL
jgi:hypothetical protein